MALSNRAHGRGGRLLGRGRYHHRPDQVAIGTVIAETPHFFWADQRPNSSYYEHDFGSAPTGVSEHAEIYSTTANTWHIEIGGHSDDSKNNFAGASHYISTGTESTNMTNVSEGSSKNLGFRDLSGNWHDKWTSAGSAGSAVRVPPQQTMYVRWVDPQWWVQSGQNSCSA